MLELMWMISVKDTSNFMLYRILVTKVLKGISSMKLSQRTYYASYTLLRIRVVHTIWILTNQVSFISKKVVNPSVRSVQ